MPKKTSKPKYPKVISPAATAAFTWLNKADTGQEFSDNKFKITLIIDPEEHQSKIDNILEKAKEVAIEKWGKVPKDFMGPTRDGDEAAEAKNRDEFRGMILITAKSKFQPGQVGPDRQPLADGVDIRSGDLVRASFVLVPYENTAKERVGGKFKEVKIFGVTAQLRNVQLIEKRAAAGNAGADFDDEYDDEEAEATAGETDGDDYDF